MGTAGLRGLKPLDPAKHARFKTAADYGFLLPAPTYPIDRTGGITDYGMDGNGPDPTLTVNGGQPVGDCGVCAVPAHADMITAALGGSTEAGMTADQVVDLYFTYEAETTGSAWRPPKTGAWTAPDGLDQGVDLGDWLLWLFHNQWIEGFVKLELSQIDAALALFDVVVVGVSLNDQADAQVEAGQPWDVGPGDGPDQNDGHAILMMGAQSADGPFTWCTWGQAQPSTLAWKQQCPQQAFAVLTRDQAESKAFPFAQLETDLQNLGGTVSDAPTPEPAPTEDAGVKQEIEAELEKIGSDIHTAVDAAVTDVKAGVAKLRGFLDHIRG